MDTHVRHTVAILATTMAITWCLVSPVAVVAVASGHIIGTVSDANGPVEGYLVTAREYDVDADRWSWAGETITDQDGAYDIVLEAGSYRIAFEEGYPYLDEYWDDAHDIEAADDVMVAAGEVVSGIDALLDTPGHITGTVIDAAGQPIEGASVTCYRDGPMAITTTLADGSYDLDDLTPGGCLIEFRDADGEYVVEYFDDASEPGDATGVPALSGTTISDIDAELVPAGRISGTVTDGSAPLEDVLVAAYHADPDAYGDLEVGKYTDEQGRFDIGWLPTGTYRLVLEDSQARYPVEYWDDAATFADATDIEVTGGSTAEGLEAVLGSTTPTAATPSAVPSDQASEGEDTLSTSGTFAPVGWMDEPRTDLTETLLSDGRVLIVGGHTASAELWDPVSGEFSPAGVMEQERARHTATLLPDGRVLVVGGEDERGRPLGSAELWDPASSTFKAAGSLAEARLWHTATPLADGRVLVAGGFGDADGYGVLASAELFDPITETFSAAGSLDTARMWHSSTLLPDGRVLVVGGNGGSAPLASAELFDPDSGTFAAAGALEHARGAHTATPLADGRVMVIGGSERGEEGAAVPLASAELWDPVSEGFEPAGSVAAARYGQSATLLPDGRVLVVGGVGDEAEPIATAELWDPTRTAFVAAGSMDLARVSHGAISLPDGRVLVVGGYGPNNVLSAAEIWSTSRGMPQPLPSGLAGSLSEGRAGHTATLLRDGRVLVVGGRSELPDGEARLEGEERTEYPDSAELWDPGNGDFMEAGVLLEQRQGQTATALSDGRVLVIGGYDDDGRLASAELWDPGTGTFRSAGTLEHARSSHTATLLPDERVLVAGGISDEGLLDSLELWDPDTAAFTSAGLLREARTGHTATLLSDGRVLFVGGMVELTGVLAMPGATAEVWSRSLGSSETDPLTDTRTGHTATLLPDGRVLVAGGESASQEALASAELWDPAVGAFAPAGSLVEARHGHTATALPDGRVVVIGGEDHDGRGYLPSTETWDPATGAFETADVLIEARSEHTSTRLPDGRILVVGGQDRAGLLASAELWDPASTGFDTAAFHPAGTLAAREAATATLLADGRVLVVGGLAQDDHDHPLDSAELWDPTSGTFSAVGTMGNARAAHSAVRLPDGRVLVVGGIGADGKADDSAELWDPQSSAFGPAGTMAASRLLATATALQDGRVLVVGGAGEGFDTLTSAELWDPGSGTFEPAGLMNEARGAHTATLLADGRVLIAGGVASTQAPMVSAELWEPATGAFSTTGSLTVARGAHTANLLPDGRVLVVGGLSSGSTPTATAEIWDPTSDAFTAAEPLAQARQWHTATLLSDGRVLVVGGQGDASEPLASAESRDATSGVFGRVSGLTEARYRHTATLLPDGSVLVVGGTGEDDDPLASAELWSASAPAWSSAPAVEVQSAEALLDARTGHTATLLPDGRVLVVGGADERFLATAELWDESDSEFHPAGSLAEARSRHSAALLEDGRVLVAGGWGQGDVALASAEVWASASGTFSPAGSMERARFWFTATPMPDGRVLLIGGLGENDLPVGDAVLWDPDHGAFSPAGSLMQPRGNHTATLLPDGRVLVVGGYDDGFSRAVEMWDPARETFSPASPLAVARGGHTATLLPDGRVLVSGGFDADYAPTRSVELYDPASDTWTSAASLGTARGVHTATLEADGKVLVAGGLGKDGVPTPTTERYDPASDTWTEDEPLRVARYVHTATRLPSGRVLVTGGEDEDGSLDSAELLTTVVQHDAPDPAM